MLRWNAVPNMCPGCWIAPCAWSAVRVVEPSGGGSGVRASAGHPSVPIGIHDLRCFFEPSRCVPWSMLYQYVGALCILPALGCDVSMSDVAANLLGDMY